MRFLKNNLKLIIGFMVGAILTSGITVYAYSYFASDIRYTRDEKTITVEEALNYLYEKNENLESTIVKRAIYGEDGKNPFCDLEYTLEEDGVIVVNMGTRSLSELGLTTYFIKVNDTVVASDSLSRWTYPVSWGKRLKTGDKVTVHIDDQVSLGAAWAYINLVK